MFLEVESGIQASQTESAEITTFVVRCTNYGKGSVMSVAIDTSYELYIT